jgi:AMP-polyphosphate phosphotransferase
MGARWYGDLESPDAKGAMASRIDEIDLTRSLSAEESERRIGQAQRRLVQLRLTTAGLLANPRGPGLLVLFEGFDAAGKGGTIRRLTQGLDPRHVLVRPIGVPSAEEARHHFLWRFQPSIPGEGQMTVFDRSWYGRLLVERVDGEVTRKSARLSAGEIVEFERSLANDGVTIVKFWLHISDREQLARFENRARDPLKQWKLTEDDWHNRDKRADYLAALRDMVDWTDHPHAHWDLISAENKPYARVAVLETLIERWTHDLVKRGVPVPPPHGGDYLH